MIQAHGILAFALAAMSSSGADWPGAQGMDRSRQEAGGWVASIERERVGAEGRRARSYSQRVLRKGPQDAEPVLLHEQTSTGSVRILLREDGLLLVKPIGGRPRLFFPGTKEPVELEFPVPEKKDYGYETYVDIDSAWFLGDCLFYHGMFNPGHLQIGFVRIDAAKQMAGPGQIGVEVYDEKVQGVGYAAVPLPLVVRLGDTVLWVNTGWQNVFYPDAIQGQWKLRAVRALDLQTRQLVNRDELPEKVLRENKERLLTLLEKQAHNRAREIEVWAVGAIARVGGAKDAERLRALARTIEGVNTPDVPDEIGATGRAVKEEYDRALAALKKKT